MLRGILNYSFLQNCSIIANQKLSLRLHGQNQFDLFALTQNYAQVVELVDTLA